MKTVIFSVSGYEKPYLEKLSSNHKLRGWHRLAGVLRYANEIKSL